MGPRTISSVPETQLRQSMARPASPGAYSALSKAPDRTASATVHSQPHGSLVSLAVDSTAGGERAQSSAVPNVDEYMMYELAFVSAALCPQHRAASFAMQHANAERNASMLSMSCKVFRGYLAVARGRRWIRCGVPAGATGPDSAAEVKRSPRCVRGMSTDWLLPLDLRAEENINLHLPNRSLYRGPSGAGEVRYGRLMAVARMVWRSRMSSASSSGRRLMRTSNALVDRPASLDVL